MEILLFSAAHQEALAAELQRTLLQAGAKKVRRHLLPATKPEEHPFSAFAKSPANDGISTPLLLVWDEDLAQMDWFIESLIEEVNEQELPLQLILASSTPTLLDSVYWEKYWQQQYLNLRRAKRQAEPPKHVDLHLRRARLIANELPRLLARFQQLPQHQIAELRKTDYASLLSAFGLERPPTIDDSEELTPETPSPIGEVARPTFPFPTTDFTNFEDNDELSDRELDQLLAEINAPKRPSKSTDSSNFAPLSSETPVSKPQLEKSTMKDETQSTTAKLNAYNEAQRLFKTGQTEDGLHRLESIIKEFPRDPALRVHYAKALLTHRQALEPASEHLRQALMLDPDFEDAIFLQAELYEARDMPQQAMRYYKRLANINPEFPELYTRITLLSAGALNAPDEEVLEWAEKALDEAEADPEVLYIKAEALNGLNQEEDALDTLDALLEIDPEHPFGNYLQALIFYKRDDFASAKAAYEQAVRINTELKTPQNDLVFLKTPAIAPATNQPEVTPTTATAKPADKKVDQTVFITGATSGIGRATARVFAREGYRLVITGRREERLAELKKELVNDYGVAVKTLVFDVRDFETAKQEVRKLRSAFAKVDILINNAGLAKGLAPIHEGKLEHWETMIDTNLKGLLYMTRLITPGMVKRGGGHVINVASTAGKEVYPNGNVYCATKFGVDALTKGMRLDLVQHNIRVSQVAPAHVEETEFALNRFDGDEKKAQIYDDFQPLTATDVAETIFFIASRPAHVNILDVVLQGQQQASSTMIHRSGR